MNPNLQDVLEELDIKTRIAHEIINEGKDMSEYEFERRIEEEWEVWRYTNR